MKALSAKKAPELADAVKEAASQPGKAVTKAVREARTAACQRDDRQESLRKVTSYESCE